jgi:hypothetical protein
MDGSCRKELLTLASREEGKDNECEEHLKNKRKRKTCQRKRKMKKMVG